MDSSFTIGSLLDSFVLLDDTKRTVAIMARRHAEINANERGAKTAEY